MNTHIPKQEQQIETLIRSIGTQDTPELVTLSLTQKMDVLKNSTPQNKLAVFVGYLSNSVFLPFQQLRYAVTTVCLLGILTAIFFVLPNFNQTNVAFAQVLEHIHKTTGFTITQSSRLSDGGGISIQEKKDKIAAAGLSDDINTLTEKLQSLRDGTETYLGIKTVDGKDSIGFEMTKNGIQYIIWANPIDGLPYQAEIVYSLPGNDEWRLTLKQFSFNGNQQNELSNSITIESNKPGEIQSSIHTQSIQSATDSMHTSGSAGGSASGSRSSSGGFSSGFSSGKSPMNSNPNHGTYGGGGSGGSTYSGSSINGRTTHQWSGSNGGGGGSGFGFGKDTRAKITEDQLIDSLQEWAIQNKGVFPDSLNRGQAFQMYFHSNDLTNTSFDSNLKEFLNKIGPAVTFTRQYRRLGWQYNGAGIKLGENKPICWWKPQNTNTYRVLYGDLKVRDVQTGKLPSIHSN